MWACCPILRPGAPLPAGPGHSPCTPGSKHPGRTQPPQPAGRWWRCSSGSGSPGGRGQRPRPEWLHDPEDPGSSCHTPAPASAQWLPPKDPVAVTGVSHGYTGHLAGRCGHPNLKAGEQGGDGTCPIPGVGHSHTARPAPRTGSRTRGRPTAGQGLGHSPGRPCGASPRTPPGRPGCNG